ncbi:hypothetical protein [Ensifer aridi]|uniref:hypothetical protein n=1 Tax=Ensifer aridi TaxID=1708715 RepID=UPI000A11A5D8|nr:hypothetical protein [Ensifer aridi]
MGLIDAVDRQKQAFRQLVKDAIAESHALGRSVAARDEDNKLWWLHPDGSRTEIKKTSDILKGPGPCGF